MKPWLVLVLLLNLWPSPGPGHAPYDPGGASSVAAAFTARPIQGSTCVVPCAVHFDAIGMGKLSTTPYVTTETTDSAFDREFHSLLYEWNFGDPNSGTWTTGAAAATATPQPRNYDIGAIGGHLYTVAGTYTVTLTVTNPAGETSTVQHDVTVTDPGSHFSAANTFCFANSGSDWTGCPLDCGTDDNCTVTADLDLALEGGNGCTGGTADCATIQTTQQRVLLRRGDTFIASTTVDPNPGSTPGLIEAFGSGAKPILDLGGNVLESGVGWTFVDLAIEDCNTSCITGTVNDFRATYVRVEADYHAACFQNNPNLPWPTEAYDEWPYLWALIDVDCTGVAGQAGYGNYPTANYILWMGGTQDHAPAGGSLSTVRAMHLQHSLIAHRTWINPASGREHLQLRTSDVIGSSVCGTLEGEPPVPNADECSAAFNILSDNYLEETASNTYYTVRLCVDAGCNCGLSSSSCGDNTDRTIAPVHDYIFERNFHQWPNGTAAAKTAIYEIQGGGVTIRNNVYDLQGGFTGGFGMVEALGEPLSKINGDTPDGDIHIYNNTIYFSDSISSNFAVASENTSNGTGCTANCYARNNLVVAPNFTAALTTVGFTASENLEIQTPNPFIATVPARGATEIDDFALAVGSAPVGAGYDFASGTDTDRWVYDDAMRLCRPGNADGWDVGAHEYGASACY